MSGDINWLEGFLETIHAESNASQNTLDAYRRDLIDSIDFLKHQKRDLKHADRADIERDLIALESDGLAQATSARRLSAINQIQRYGVRESLMTYTP